MASTYTGLIEELRRAAAHDKAEIERIGIACDCDLAEAAADAIETLSKGIAAYERANTELNAWKNNAQDWMCRVAEEKEQADRMSAAAHEDAAEEIAKLQDIRASLRIANEDAMKECANLRRRITELEGLLSEREIETQGQEAETDPAPVWIASRKSILEDAEKCVCGHREGDYGSPEDSFATIANLWTAYSGYPFNAVDVAMMMALLKIARIAGGRGSEDSFVDLAGYAACGGEIWSKREAMEG